MITQLTEMDFIEASNRIGCDVSVVKGLAEVESNGEGFFNDGSPKLLFEGHVFWSQLEKKGFRVEELSVGNEDVLFKQWDRTHYIGGVGEYKRLHKAINIGKGMSKEVQNIIKECALNSCSWGMFQIMGYHAESLGYKDVFDFVFNLDINIKAHLDSFVRFVKRKTVNRKPISYWMKMRNWRMIAKGYNGRSYEKNNWHIKIEVATKKYDR